MVVMVNKRVGDGVFGLFSFSYSSSYLVFFDRDWCLESRVFDSYHTTKRKMGRIASVTRREDFSYRLSLDVKFCLFVGSRNVFGWICGLFTPIPDTFCLEIYFSTYMHLAV